MWRHFCYVFLPIGNFFHHVRAFFARFFFLWWALFTMWGHFCYFFLYVIGLFCLYRRAFFVLIGSLFGLANPPYENFYGRLCLPPCGRPCSFIRAPMPPPPARHQCKRIAYAFYMYLLVSIIR